MAAADVELPVKVSLSDYQLIDEHKWFVKLRNVHWNGKWMAVTKWILHSFQPERRKKNDTWLVAGVEKQSLILTERWQHCLYQHKIVIFFLCSLSLKTQLTDSIHFNLSENAIWIGRCLYVNNVYYTVWCMDSVRYKQSPIENFNGFSLFFFLSHWCSWQF